MTRIAAVAGYVPRFRLASEAVAKAWGQFRGRGIDQTAVPDGDEDPVTMAHAAGSMALDAGTRDAGSVARLHFGTTTPPLEEGELTARLQSTLGLPAGVATATFTGSTRAGMQAFTGAIDAEETALVVAADTPRGDPDTTLEHGAGAGAAAILLTPDGEGQIPETATHTEPYPGTRFRERSEAQSQELGVRQYDREAFQTTIQGAVNRLDTVNTVDAAAIQAPDGDLPYRAGAQIGLSEDEISAGLTVRETGDVGAASPLLGIVAAVNEGADRILGVGYGSGSGATAIQIVGGTEIPVALAMDGTVSLSFVDAKRRLGDFDGEPVRGGGAYVSFPSWRASLPQRHRLEAGECSACETVVFPPTGACPSCGTVDMYQPVTLPGTGTVVATTTIQKGGAPPEFADQQTRSGAYDSAIVEMDALGDTNVRVPLQIVHTEDESVAVGDRVEAIVRRIYTQEGVPRYGCKAMLASAVREEVSE